MLIPMGLETLSAPGAQTVSFFFIIRTHINKTIHRHVVGPGMAAMGYYTSQNDAIFVWAVHAIYSYCLVL